MNINYSTVKEKILVKFITIFILLTIVSSICSVFIVKDIDKKIKKVNEKKIQYIYNNLPQTQFLDIICAISGCYSIYLHDLQKGGFIELKKEPTNLYLMKSPNIISYLEILKDYNTKTAAWMELGANNDILIKYPLNTITFSEFSLRNILLGLFILCIISIILSIIIVYVDLKYNSYKQIRNKHAIYDTLRLELTESLHHELAGPISVIESNIQYFIKKYEAQKAENDIAERLDSTLIVIESMKSILGTISQFKKIKYQNDNILISVLLDSISALNRINTYNVTNITVLDKDIINGYYASGKLSDGLLFNILMTLINNSNEAGSSLITITPKVNNGLMDLYISDNGHGILNEKGNLESNCEKLFAYGYSTKEDQSTYTDFHIIKKILKALTSTDLSLISSRGAGLPIARKFLRENGGDIVVESTSHEGTVFKITFPVFHKSK